jgi:hypothetical protein
MLQFSDTQSVMKTIHLRSHGTRHFHGQKQTPGSNSIKYIFGHLTMLRYITIKMHILD